MGLGHMDRVDFIEIIAALGARVQVEAQNPARASSAATGMGRGRGLRSKASAPRAPRHRGGRGGYTPSRRGGCPGPPAQPGTPVSGRPCACPLRRSWSSRPPRRCEFGPAAVSQRGARKPDPACSTPVIDRVRRLAIEPGHVRLGQPQKRMDDASPLSTSSSSTRM